MALNCDLAALIAASAQFVEPAISGPEREAIEIYARVQSLNTNGGADLTNINDLLEAAKEWQSLVGTQAEGVSAFITVQNAIDAGSAIGTNIETLSENAKCFLCLPERTRRQILLFLRCALSEQSTPA